MNETYLISKETKTLNENAKKWVEALRSGEYKQCSGALKKEGGYCCLGVATELALKEGVIDKFKGDDDEEIVYLCIEVREWLGLATNNGFFTKEEKYNSLTTLNDKGTSFSEIADVIESEPPGLFTSNSLLKC